ATRYTCRSCVPQPLYVQQINRNSRSRRLATQQFHGLGPMRGQTISKRLKAFLVARAMTLDQPVIVVEALTPRERLVPVDNREVRLCCSLRCEEGVASGSSTDATRDTPQIDDLYSLRDPDVLLQVLQLNQEQLLHNSWRRGAFMAVQLLARALPALVIYGGTFSLMVCAICQYRWGVLLSLTMFSIYMVHLSVSILVYSVLGLFHASGESTGSP
ncbi:unnamed protein product, partial [Effrenium voratum]